MELIGHNCLPVVAAKSFKSTMLEQFLFIFVKSQENDSDIMTENLMGELYQIHVNKVIVQKNYFG